MSLGNPTDEICAVCAHPLVVSDRGNYRHGPGLLPAGHDYHLARPAQISIEMVLRLDRVLRSGSFPSLAGAFDVALDELPTKPSLDLLYEHVVGQIEAKGFGWDPMLNRMYHRSARPFASEVLS